MTSFSSPQGRMYGFLNWTLLGAQGSTCIKVSSFISVFPSLSQMFYKLFLRTDIVFSCVCVCVCFNNCNVQLFYIGDLPWFLLVFIKHLLWAKSPLGDGAEVSHDLCFTSQRSLRTGHISWSTTVLYSFFLWKEQRVPLKPLGKHKVRIWWK